MRIIYVAARYDYGEVSRGLSFEHYNFYETLRHMGHDIIYFDFMTEYQRRGKASMNGRLLDIVRAERPDLLFCFLLTDELHIETMRFISEHTDTVTFNWFADDHWRFEDFSRHWAPSFNWVSTTAQSAVPKYKRIGYANVIKTQWACNHFLYHPLNLSPHYDVTFVGQPHGTRRVTIDALRRAGVEVQTWGQGWDTGRISQEAMIEVFNRSRVNLNLAAASWPPVETRWRKRISWPRSRPAQQIKGRNFEIPGCGAFLLTDVAENLKEYYVPQREVGVFRNVRDLARTVRFYLDHPSERQRIAEAGYRRTLVEHTYEKRFNDIFAIIGLNTARQARTEAPVAS